jgi:hypothetical protein
MYMQGMTMHGASSLVYPIVQTLHLRCHDAEERNDVPNQAKRAGALLDWGASMLKEGNAIEQMSTYQRSYPQMRICLQERAGQNQHGSAKISGATHWARAVSLCIVSRRQ